MVRRLRVLGTVECRTCGEEIPDGTIALYEHGRWFHEFCVPADVLDPTVRDPDDDPLASGRTFESGGSIVFGAAMLILGSYFGSLDFVEIANGTPTAATWLAAGAWAVVIVLGLGLALARLRVTGDGEVRNRWMFRTRRLRIEDVATLERSRRGGPLWMPSLVLRDGRRIRIPALIGTWGPLAAGTDLVEVAGWLGVPLR